MAELRIWLLSGGEPFVFELSHDHAEMHYGVISGSCGDALPVGSVSFKDGTLIPVRAIAAVRITLDERERPRPTRAGWVSNAAPAPSKDD